MKRLENKRYGKLDKVLGGGINSVATGHSERTFVTINTDKHMCIDTNGGKDCLTIQAPAQE